MIRFSIFFLPIFFFLAQIRGMSQDSVTFTCYNLDSISWSLTMVNCPNSNVDSFQIHTQTQQGADFNLMYTGTDPSIKGFRNDVFKTGQAVFVRYFTDCPTMQIVQSDTMSLSALRDAVALDSVRILANGDVELTWKEKPISGIRYVVNAAVQGSSQVLATNLQTNRYVDMRSLATRNIEYYSISATLDCGYTLPEPDSFYHTSLLHYNLAKCGGEITFDFTPFSYWKNGTSEAALIILRDGQGIDTLPLAVGQTSFTYNELANNETYTFFVRELGSEENTQIAYSNPITINTDYYEPISWIVINDLSLDAQNQATISWTTNKHSPDYLFQLLRDGEAFDISKSELINSPGTYTYSYVIPDFSPDLTEYQISLKDSCGNSILSSPKRILLTQGQLNGSIDLSTQWTDITDAEWDVQSYDVFYKTDGSFMLLGSVDGNTFQYPYVFDESNPPDSVCYYLVAKGETFFTGADSSSELSVRSNTVCLFGETIIQLPNAYNPNTTPYKPIIVPLSNISSYVFNVFDRYGSLVFESRNPSEGWQGQYQGKDGFMDVYVVKVEVTTSQGEKIVESGSVLVFP